MEEGGDVLEGDRLVDEDDDEEFCRLGREGGMVELMVGRCCCS